MTIIIIPTALVQAWVFWKMSDGVIQYEWNIAIAAAHLAVELVQVIYDSAQWSVLAWIPLEIWIILTMLRGIRKQKALSSKRPG